MRDEAYDAFYESVEEADSNPVRFQFTEEEVEEYGISEDSHEQGAPTLSFSDEVIWNLSERGYPYIRCALIFEVMAERLK